MLVVDNDLGHQANDKGQLVPMVHQAKANGFEPQEALADTGYYSQTEVQALEENGIEAFVAVERQTHGRSLASILGEEEPRPETQDPSPRQKMKLKNDSFPCWAPASSPWELPRVEKQRGCFPGAPFSSKIGDFSGGLPLRRQIDRKEPVT